MHARTSPQETYRRVEFDARVAGASAFDLVGLCYEQLIAAIGSALFAHERSDNGQKSRALTRALSAITALQLGVSDSEEGVAGALRHFYEAARRTVLDSVIDFDGPRLASLQGDVRDIAGAMLDKGRKVA